MASTPEPNRTIHNSDNENGSGIGASYFQKTVCLYDWWLVRAENDFNGKRLAVAGLTSRPEQPVRIFSSAPILKRYDIFTLETADGICVVIKGFINKVRTTDNGFSDEVFKHFVFGFPPNWETCASSCFEAESSDNASPGNSPDTNKLFGESKTADGGGNDCTPTNVNSPLCKISTSKEGEEQLSDSPSKFGSKSIDRLRILKNSPKSSLKNLDAMWEKVKMTTSGWNTERSKINSPPACSSSMENIVHDGKSDAGSEVSNICDEQPSMSTHGYLVNTQDNFVCGTGSLPENDATQGLNHGDAMTQDVTKKMDVTKTAVSFTSLVGSHHKTGVDIHDEEITNKGKKEKASQKKVKRKILFNSLGNRITRQQEEEHRIISPECLSYGRSRSGRLLLPTLEFWRNQLPVYDVDRRILGIQEGLPMVEPPRGSKSEPRRKRAIVNLIHLPPDFP